MLYINKNSIDLDDGLDYYTFKNGIYQVFVQSEELAIRIFNTIDFNLSGFNSKNLLIIVILRFLELGRVFELNGDN